MSLNRKGFTLPELLVTAFIMAFSLSAILTTYINTVMLNESCRNMTTAISHAEFVLENLRNTSFASIPTNITSGVWNWNSAAVTAQGLKALNSEVVTTSYQGSNPIDILVTVSWNDTHGRARTQILKTSISG